ncbi:MAG: sulfotransferase [Bacteroidales bacterium]|nr:sulfotransferase [Bacteroidales bacterium]
MGRNKSYTVREHQLYTALPQVWKRLRRENNIHRTCRFRALRIGFYSRLFASGFLLQRLFFSKRIQELSFEEHPPLFILGLWRTGTTHLHYLIARDSRFGFLNNHQAFTFNISLLSMDRLNRILNIFMPDSRPQDNVRLSLDDPAEEEQALCTTTTRSSMHSFFFPQNRTYFRKYHLFEGISGQEKAAWKRDYLNVLKNIAFYCQKNKLVLKNPHNTGRVKEILELFPKAKFIFLHREPYAVYSSSKILYERMISSQFLQPCSENEIEQIILEQNPQIMRKYLSERELIPKGNLVEIGFSELVNTPIKTLKTIYKELHLDGFEDARPSMEAYLDSVRNYKRNTCHPPSRSILDRIHSEWDFWIKAFGYSL